MTLPLDGDPGGCSQAGGSMRRLAAQLRAAQTRLDAVAVEVEVPWSGRVARTVGRTRQSLSSSTLAAADRLDRAGGLLQEHSSDLAEAVAIARSVAGRAQAAGLEVVDGRVIAAWGVAGVADEERNQTRESQRASLQHELDTAALHLQRKRARLAAALDAARADLASHSSVLRA